MTDIATLTPFGKDAGFWENCGIKAMKQKNYVKAALMYRKALSVSPDLVYLHLRYANALQGLGCYEKSNVHVLDALSLEPSKRTPFFIMCGNFIQMGNQRRLIDTCLFMFEGSQDPNDLKVQQMFGLTPDMGQEDWRQVRYERCIRHAIDALIEKDCKTAERWLQKIHGAVLPILKAAIRLCEIWLSGLQKQFFFVSEEIAQMRPHLQSDMDLLLLAARACFAQQNKELAGILLLRASTFMTLKDELHLMQTALDCGHPNIAKAVALKQLKATPNRLPSCYNLAKLLFMEKKPAQAKQYVKRCLDASGLDPYVRLLCHSQTMRKASALPFYGQKRSKDMRALFAPLSEKLEQGTENFAYALDTHADLRELFLLAASYPSNEYTKCLPDIIAPLTQQRASQILRRILLEATERSDLTHYAGKTLCELFQTPPFGASFDEHLVPYDPTKPVLKPKPPFPKRLENRFWKRMQRRHAHRANTFAWWLLRTMPKEAKKQALVNKEGLWQLAFDQVWTGRTEVSEWVEWGFKRNPKDRETYFHYHAHIAAWVQQFRREYP